MRATITVRENLSQCEIFANLDHTLITAPPDLVIALRGPNFHGGAQSVAVGLGGAFLMGGERRADIAVVEDRLGRSIGFLDLVQGLDFVARGKAGEPLNTVSPALFLEGFRRVCEAVRAPLRTQADSADNGLERAIAQTARSSKRDEDDNA